MSTGLEATVAHALGVHVAAIPTITNSSCAASTSSAGAPGLITATLTTLVLVPVLLRSGGSRGSASPPS